MLIRPTKRSQIKLSAYSKILNIIKDLKADEDLQVSNRLAIIWNDEKKVDKASRKEIEEYNAAISELLNSSIEVEPKQIIRIGLQSFGLEPYIEAMDFGAFTDISTLSNDLASGDNVARLMAILYRPIKGGVFFKKVYNLTNYRDEKQAIFEERVKLFNDQLTLEELQGVLAFFLQNQRR